MTVKHYRSVWIENFGSIPRDEDGRAYEIHHKDGNHMNNHISNLECITINEHLDRHVERGEWGAAMLIAKRMGKTPEELSSMQRGNKHSPEVREKISKSRLASKKPAWNKGINGYSIRANRKGNRFSSKLYARDVIFMRSCLKNDSIKVVHRRKDSTRESSLAWWLQENYYPQISLQSIRNILLEKSWKEVAFYENSDFEILTPSGYQDFKGIVTRNAQGMFRITFEDGSTLRCTPDHKVKTTIGFYEAKELTYSHKIETENGLLGIKYLDIETRAETVYDPTDVQNGNQYYSNGVVSHNCEFISSEAMLIDSIKLAFFKPAAPINENMGFRFWKEVGGQGKTYLVGVDPATGNGSDFTVIEVVEFPSMEQVAELRLNSVNIPLIYAKIKWLLKHLRQPDANRRRSDVVWSFERNGVGEALVAMIQNDDSIDGGVHLDGVELFNENQARLGVYTTGKSKLVSCMQLKNMLEKIKGGLIIRSDTLIFELANFIAAGGTYQAKSGCTDDAVMAMCVIMKLLNRMSSYDDTARALVYETVSPDSDIELDQFGDDPMPYAIV